MVLVEGFTQQRTKLRKEPPYFAPLRPLFHALLHPQHSNLSIINSKIMAKGARVLARYRGITKACRFRKGLIRVSKRQRNEPNFPGEPDYKVRVKAACSMYINCKDLRNKKSEQMCANWFGVVKSTVYCRLIRVKSAAKAYANLQRLSPLEEEALVEWC